MGLGDVRRPNSTYLDLCVAAGHRWRLSPRRDVRGCKGPNLQDGVFAGRGRDSGYGSSPDGQNLPRICISMDHVLHRPDHGAERSLRALRTRQTLRTASLWAHHRTVALSSGPSLGHSARRSRVGPRRAPAVSSVLNAVQKVPHIERPQRCAFPGWSASIRRVRNGGYDVPRASQDSWICSVVVSGLSVMSRQ